MHSGVRVTRTGNTQPPQWQTRALVRPHSSHTRTTCCRKTHTLHFTRTRTRTPLARENGSPSAQTHTRARASLSHANMELYVGTFCLMIGYASGPPFSSRHCSVSSILGLSVLSNAFFEIWPTNCGRSSLSAGPTARDRLLRKTWRQGRVVVECRFGERGDLPFCREMIMRRDTQEETRMNKCTRVKARSRPHATH